MKFYHNNLGHYIDKFLLFFHVKFDTFSINIFTKNVCKIVLLFWRGWHSGAHKPGYQGTRYFAGNQRFRVVDIHYSKC
jgi:hypothetical protein